VNPTRTNYEGGVGSLLSPQDSEALEVLMREPAIPVTLPGAAGRLAVVLFSEADWPVWSGVHMPDDNGAPPEERDIVYQRSGGSFDTGLTDDKLLAFGGQAEFTQRPDGSIEVTSLPAGKCEICPPGEAREVLSECLAADAMRFEQGYPAVALTMQSLARDTARQWPFEDSILRAAVGTVLGRLGCEL